MADENDEEGWIGKEKTRIPPFSNEVLQAKLVRIAEMSGSTVETLRKVFNEQAEKRGFWFWQIVVIHEMLLEDKNSRYQKFQQDEIAQKIAAECDLTVWQLWQLWEPVYMRVHYDEEREMTVADIMPILHMMGFYEKS